MADQDFALAQHGGSAARAGIGAGKGGERAFETGGEGGCHGPTLARRPRICKGGTTARRPAF
ncbi:hypothetical protein STHU_24630 [Allostella humosa]|nr:hypothetical protein STHU_24630 [Stella humosa]